MFRPRLLIGLLAILSLASVVGCKSRQCQSQRPVTECKTCAP